MNEYQVTFTYCINILAENELDAEGIATDDFINSSITEDDMNITVEEI